MLTFPNILRNMNAAYCQHVEGSDGTDHTDQAQNPGAG